MGCNLKEKILATHYECIVTNTFTLEAVVYLKLMTEVRFDTQKIKFGLFLFCKTRLLNIQAIVAIDNAVKPLVRDHKI